MKFEVDTRIRDKYFKGKIRVSQPEEIVIHATAGLGTISWMLAGGDMGNGKSRAEDYKKGVGLFHAIIARDGKVTEIIDPDLWVYHSSSDEHDGKTIGIELSKSEADNSDAPTPEQYRSLVDYIIKLKQKYASINDIVSHDYNARKYSNRPPKPCPGEFDWEWLINTLEGRLYYFNVNS